MRCFVGLPLPAGYQENFAALRRLLAPDLRSRLTWTRPGNGHLTLRFLGEIDPAMAQAVGNGLEKLRFSAFTLQPGPLRFFPLRGRPKVLWLGLEQGAAESAALAARLAETLADLGLPPANAPFTPHLTVARVREAQADPWPQLAARAAEVSWPATVIDRVVLWQSHLGPGGPRYAALAETPARDPA